LKFRSTIGGFNGACYGVNWFLVAQKAGSGSGSIVTGVVSRPTVLLALYGFPDARIHRTIGRDKGTMPAELAGANSRWQRTSKE